MFHSIKMIQSFFFITKIRPRCVYIMEYIREDKAENGDQCPFTNDDLYNLQGYSDEDVAQWKVECCMDMDGLD